MLAVAQLCYQSSCTNSMYISIYICIYMNVSLYLCTNECALVMHACDSIPNVVGANSLLGDHIFEIQVLDINSKNVGNRKDVLFYPLL